MTVAEKLQDRLAYPPRAMRAERAAAYLSMSKAEFLKLVDEGILPKPVKIRSMATWDRYDLDDAYQAIKDEALPQENTVLKALSESRSHNAKPREKV